MTHYRPLKNLLLDKCAKLWYHINILGVKPIRCHCCNSQYHLSQDYKTKRWYCHSCWEDISQLIVQFGGICVYYEEIDLSEFNLDTDEYLNFDNKPLELESFDDFE